MASEAVYNFMKQQNIPFSLNDIHNSFKDMGKSAVQKALDKLINEDKVIEKTYGKQKVYCVRQDDDYGGNIQEELKTMDRQINQVAFDLKEEEEKLEKNLFELKQSDGKMPLAEAKMTALEMEEEIAGIKSKIEKFKEHADDLSEKDKKNITEMYNKYCGEYKKRKRLCMDIIEAILEGYPKSKKHLLEETEIETDESVGFKFEEIKLK